MSGEVVKFHNDLNTVIMRKWTPEEMNFFFAIIAKSKESGTGTLVFDTDEIKELVKYNQKDDRRWREMMKSTAKRVTQLTYYEDKNGKFEVMTLLSKFSVDFENKKVEIEVSKNFEYVLNNLAIQFTQYELEEFTVIRSTYAKTAYRLFKQWRTIGRKEFSIEEFKTLLDMPKSYKSSEIDRAVITPIIKELSPIFEGLKVKKIKSNKRGNPVLGYEFTFKADKSSGSWVEGKYQKNKRYKFLKSNVPEWSNSDYQNNITQEELSELEKRRLELLAKIDNKKNT